MRSISRLPGLLLAIWLVSSPGPVLQAQEDQSAAPASPVAEFIVEDQQTGEETGSPVEPSFELPDLTGLQALDPETLEAALSSIREYYRYKKSGYQHRRATFDWQLQSSKILFFVVIVLVGVGIWFSGVQFYAALRPPPHPPEDNQARETQAPASGEGGEAPSPPAAAPLPAASLQTSLEAGSGGIKVSSPVLGVIILVLSFLFFYLYLLHVYPIREIW